MLKAPAAPIARTMASTRASHSVVKHRLVRLGLDLAEAVHAAHVVHAVHDGAPGVLGKPVPIMESRVTSSASCSSLQPSVPAGRIGSTRKRVSAVESQTRISMSFGRLDAEIGEHAARVLHRAGAIGRGLVPDRRQPQHFPGITGAQRAHDHVVALRRVLDHDEMIADAADMAERADALVASSSSACLKAGSVQALATTRAPLCGPILVS